MTATIDLPPHWALIALYSENERTIMERISIIMGISVSQNKFRHTPPFKMDGCKWQLDYANNYWAEIRDGKLLITGRYDDDKFKTLVEFCKVWL